MNRQFKASVNRLAAKYLGRLSLHDPEFNLREIAKQMLLLEEHLFHPHKLCPDCVRKHLLTIEALADEMAALIDTSVVTVPDTTDLRREAFRRSDEAKQWLSDFHDGALPQDIGLYVRQSRKELVKLIADPRKLNLSEH